MCFSHPAFFSMIICWLELSFTFSGHDLVKAAMINKTALNNGTKKEVTHGGELATGFIEK